jgi:hypothetical protein
MLVAARAAARAMPRARWLFMAPLLRVSGIFPTRTINSRSTEKAKLFQGFQQKTPHHNAGGGTRGAPETAGGAASTRTVRGRAVRRFRVAAVDLELPPSWSQRFGRLRHEPLSAYRLVDRPAVPHDVVVRDDALLERRVDVVEIDVGDEAVDAGTMLVGASPCTKPCAGMRRASTRRSASPRASAASPARRTD